jgi:hypothetical protein
MKRLSSFAVLLVALVPAALPAPTAQARACYKIWAEAARSESHYRHTVYVENDCEEWLECSVWTDEDPNPPKILSVAPGATESVETNGRSQYDDPKAFGTCRFK